MHDQRFEFHEVSGKRPRPQLRKLFEEGMSQTPKRLPTHLLYDHQGSEIFEKITELPEYYLTRTERSILDSKSSEILDAAGANLAIIEFGSGSSSKTRLLLEEAMRRQETLTYVPIDISANFLRESSQNLLNNYPRLRVKALGAEYFDAADAFPEHDGPRLILFLGSNIGNLTHEEAIDFLGRICWRMKPVDRLLVGVDLVKDRATLEAAYNDLQGVTAAFNKNLLQRVNRELHTDFKVPCFAHHAPYDERTQRIEMRLVSVCDQDVNLPDGVAHHFRVGEYIHTEWSHKYTRESFTDLVFKSGLELEHFWTDPDERFAVTMLRGVE
jgi:L-histidine Nalpha-methyltransferase